ncbi:hypothetical protein AWZ03_010136 [Drosophila navojoa]|uniref:Gustatory receptor n=1 Tax=Drosophila navojoa TaxID=7232 RepID=A0A484B438_DRONA|nr:hypothetical protein AWZ03_010136 [Drosophila navojoa]
MISKIVVAVKCLLLLHDVVNYLVLGLAVWICFSKVDNAEGQNYTMNLLIQGILMYVFRRIFFFLHSEADRKVMMHMLNEIFYITCTIEKKYGMNYHIEMSLLCVYSCKMCLMYIMLDALWHRFTFWIIFLYWMLLEYCFHGYLIYQLLLLNWYRNLNYVLQRFLENNQSESFISGRYHRRLLWLFKLYLRINNLHKFIQENIAWFPAAIYLGIFSSIFNMTLMIQCIVYAEDDIDDKLYILMDGCLCPAVIPILNVLIIGICTDRIRSEELTMQQHIVLVSVLLFRKSDPHDFRLKVINSEVS